MTTPTRRLRAAATRPLCAACHEPMTPVDGHRTHPSCDPVCGWPPWGGSQAPAPPDEPPRQLRLVT